MKYLIKDTSPKRLHSRNKVRPLKILAPPRGPILPDPAKRVPVKVKMGVNCAQKSPIARKDWTLHNIFQNSRITGYRLIPTPVR